MTQKLRHLLPPRKNGGSAHTEREGRRKQGNNLGSTGHGESESEEGTLERRLDEMCALKAKHSIK